MNSSVHLQKAEIPCKADLPLAIILSQHVFVSYAAECEAKH